MLALTVTPPIWFCPVSTAVAMKLSYYQGKHPNFGDELNPWLWQKLLPHFFDDDPGTVFLGIGSILGMQEFPRPTRKVVFGSGFVPEYHPAPLLDESWDVFFVRGPRTARALGLAEYKAVTDPAVLIRTLPNLPPHQPESVTFIPHWQSVTSGNWQEACALAGISFLDPRKPVEEVLATLLKSSVVLCEAMHGAIVADALRIPWIPIQPQALRHRGKWLDWSDSLDLDLYPQQPWPSALKEARLSFLRKPLTRSPLAGFCDRQLTELAAGSLQRIAQAPACLSQDSKIDALTGRMLEELDALQRKYPPASIE